jgi:hypothetical protein
VECLQAKRPALALSDNSTWLVPWRRSLTHVANKAIDIGETWISGDSTDGIPRRNAVSWAITDVYRLYVER